MPSRSSPRPTDLNPPPAPEPRGPARHGAAADTFMSHLAMLEARPDGADPTTWLEPVADEHYQDANQH
ncbi:MAG TPA: hypothetical protein VFC19_33450 [Candidatus Limnocylindrales bacterium]|nr:hypothetical protein [Candidatus Limnocylindrales bacterium]